MNQLTPAQSNGGYDLLASRHQVLRNTYGLLALSLLPTVLGAYVGLKTGLVQGLGGGMGILLFLAGAYGFIFAIEKNKNSGLGVGLLLAFTFFMGLMLSRMLGFILAKGNGAELVMTAFGGTAAIFATMASLATVIKRDLSAMGKWLFIGFLVVFFGSLLNYFFVQSGPLMLVLTFAILGIFSAYLLYDVKRIIDGGETNYISATLGIYISLYNIFQSLLSLLGIFGGED